MTSQNTPAADRGISHGEELERNAMNTALHDHLTAEPDACPWQGYDNCRNCGLYGNCFTLEAKPETTIETGNDICRMIKKLETEAHRLGIIGEATNGEA